VAVRKLIRTVRLPTQAAWTSLDYDDSAWEIKERTVGITSIRKLKDYHGAGLYRAKFNTPDSWVGRRILFNLSDFDIPIVI